jgi:hypothetical protein
MTDKAGVWIDHRRAVLVVLDAEGAHCHEILSNVEKHSERGGDRPMHGSYEAHQVPADDSRQRALSGELNTYFDAVVAALRKFSPLLLLGPGEAKGELHKRLIKLNHAAVVAAVLTEDKMTEPQLVAKVRSYFGEAPPRVLQAI